MSDYMLTLPVTSQTLESVTPNDAWHVTSVRGEVVVRYSPAGTLRNKNRAVSSVESRSGSTFLSLY